MIKFKHWFDKKMINGTSYMIYILTIFTILSICLLVAILFLTGKIEKRDFTYSTWTIISAIVNAEMPDFVDGFFKSFIFGIAAIVGLFVTSFLIGIISNVIEERIKSISNGNTQILEDVDTLIIGFNNITFAVLKELIDANLNQEKCTIVILDDNCEKIVMNDKVKIFLDEYDKEYYRRCIKEKIAYKPRHHHVQIICRYGSSFLKRNLDICNFESAKSIIVNVEDDYNVIKVIMACRGMIDELKLHELLAKHNEVFIGYRKSLGCGKYNVPKFNPQKFNINNIPDVLTLKNEDYLITVSNQNFFDDQL
ncbi:MAG: hypothetical protein SPI53_01310 [Erysipelotrichaceae bacterium]|nr:hypothetical protein [Erysipelotrichaceae bacterium]